MLCAHGVMGQLLALDRERKVRERLKKVIDMAYVQIKHKTECQAKDNMNTVYSTAAVN